MTAIVPGIDSGVDFVGLVDVVDCFSIVPETGKMLIYDF